MSIDIDIDIDINKPLRWTAEAADGSGRPDPATFEMLGSLQGNILKGHGRPEVTLLFFRIVPGAAESAKAVLRDIASHHVTSAWQQLQDARRLRQTGAGGGAFVHLALAQSGYRALGFGNLHAGIPGSEVFHGGMAASAKAVDDDPAGWEPAFREPIDGVVLAAHLYRAATDRLADELQALMTAGGACTIVRRQQGKGLDNAAGQGIEHFGYVDGRSQPLLLEEDIQAEADGTQPQRITQWDPAFPLRTALVKDPGTRHPLDFGSYFIFRKLDQNVQAFKRAEHDVADRLCLQGEDRELAGAMLVGRFEDGTPAVQSSNALGGAVPNDFDYRDDVEGVRCPFHSHIRKTNPRGAGGRPDKPNEALTAAERAEVLRQEREHLFVRRGIPYEDEPRAVHPKDLPRADDRATFEREVAPKLPTGQVGLLFMAYNRDLAGQFVFMQKLWANNARFPFAGDGVHGLDPVIGQGASTPGDQKLPLRWGASKLPSLPITFGGHVTMKGGEYFFSPSLRFLMAL